LLDSLLQERIPTMLSKLVGSLGRLTLHHHSLSTNTRTIAQIRNLHTAGGLGHHGEPYRLGINTIGACTQLNSQSLGRCGLPLGQSALLVPAQQTYTCKRTWFKPMDEYGRGETAAEGHGVTLYSPKDGKRTSLKAVELRFKRLDWGMWIRTRAGRNKKHWKKCVSQLRKAEKHFFCVPYHIRRFDLAVKSDLKDVRHIPDDPYKVYNDMSYQNYHALRVKNSERVIKYGSKLYKFPWYRAHFKKNIIFTDKNDTYWYEPPGYHKDLANGNGVYTPEDRAENIPPPDYILEERGVSKVQELTERKYFKRIRRGEQYYGELSPTHPLRLPVYGTWLGL